MSGASWALVVLSNGLACHFLWWFAGLDGRCRRHLSCIVRRRLGVQ